MAEPKTECKECGASFLEATAKQTGGYCRKCKPDEKTEKVTFADMVENVEFGVRFLFAAIFAVIFAGLGYFLGAWIWSGVGILVGAMMAPIGAIYGFFKLEINFFLKLAFRMIFHI